MKEIFEIERIIECARNQFPVFQNGTFYARRTTFLDNLIKKVRFIVK